MNERNHMDCINQVLKTRPRRYAGGLGLTPRALVVAFMALAVAAWPSPAAASRAESETVARAVTIYRDSFGVPHVFAPTDADCVFGFAYAQAEDNFRQIEDNYLRALGRAAEAHGAKALPDDLIVRALELPKLALAEYQRAPAGMRRLYDAFAAGLNHFLAHDRGVKPLLISRFEGWQVLAFARYEVYKLFVIEAGGLQVGDLGSLAAARGARPPVGSNMWAVGPRKSADGHAMLFINPHVFFFGATQFYEGHLHSDAGWDLSGATCFGLPFPVLGHNAALGWSHTVNYPSIFTLYSEQSDDAKYPLAYRYGGEHRAAVRSAG